MNAVEPWVLGIDFGTSFTVAAARGARHAEVIEVGGERRVPSVVLADEDGTVVVGRAAENLATAQPGRAIRAPKNRLGEPAPVVLGGRTHQLTDLIASLLRYVYDEAVRVEGSPPQEVRLTHPASWGQPRLDRLLTAARSAGLPETTLVPEPVAAAVSFAEDAAVVPGGYVAVYDLGGGTFDTALLQATDAGFVVVGRPAGEDRLGGDLFDELLANHIGSHLDPRAWEALQVSDERAWQQAAAGLRAEARRVKEALSSHPYAEFLLGLPTGMVTQRVTRDEFDELVEPYVATSVDLLARTIDDGGMAADQLTAIYLAGGASRSPLVERLVSEAFPGVPVSRRGDPKTAVALGATHSRAVGSSPRHTAGPPPPPTTAVPPTAPSAPLTAAASRPAPSYTPPVPSLPPQAPPPGPSAALPPSASPPPTFATYAANPPHPGPPAAPAPVAPPPGAPLSIPRRAASRGSSRRWLVLATAAVLLVIAGVAAAVVASRGGGDGGANPTTTTRRRSAVTTTTATTGTTATEDTTPAPFTTPPTGRPPLVTTTTTPPPPTADELTAARLLVSDVGASFLASSFGPDEPYCGRPVNITSVARSSIGFDDATSGVRVDQDLQSYATHDEALAQLAELRDLVATCPVTSTTVSGLDYLIGVQPFTGAPIYCDDTEVVLQVATSTSGGPTVSRAIGVIVCGRTVMQMGYGVVGRSFGTNDQLAFFTLLERAAGGVATLPG